MIQKLKMTLLSFGALFMFAAPLLLVGQAQAQTDIRGSLCKGANLKLNSPSTDAKAATECQDEATTGSNLANLIRRIINVISVIIGAVAVIMIIFGGFRYITSGGNDASVASAKNTILYALIGLIIVALAQIIVRFVLGATSTV